MYLVKRDIVEEIWQAQKPVLLKELSSRDTYWKERVREKEDLLDDMWGLICNVNGGVIDKEKEEWYQAFLRMRNIDAVINQAQEDGKDWQFSHAQPVNEYECVAVFEKWIY